MGASAHGTDLIVTADDFGLSDAVNEGVERAHRDGILGSASLMVAGDAAADAVRRARRLPHLRVGLHLVCIEGPAVLPRAEIPDLMDASGGFGADQLGAGIAYAVSRRARAQLRAEIRAQFRAFAATGLPLDHADAHKHMHLHPMVGRLVVEIGAEFGLRAVRVPAEPPRVLRRAGVAPGAGARAMHAWCGILRRQVRRAGILAPDAVFGLAWSGHMTAERLLRLAPLLPPGIVELYFHPAAGRDALLDRLMGDYEHEAELAALCDPRVRAALAHTRATSYGAVVEGRRSGGTCTA